MNNINSNVRLFSTVLLYSLVTAFGFMSGVGGLGRSDINAYLLWTLAFALVLSVAEPFAPKTKILIKLFGFLIFSIVVAYGLRSIALHFNSFSFPVAVCWSVAGFFGLSSFTLMKGSLSYPMYFTVRFGSLLMCATLPTLIAKAWTGF